MSQIYALETKTVEGFRSSPKIPISIDPRDVDDPQMREILQAVFNMCWQTPYGYKVDERGIQRLLWRQSLLCEQFRARMAEEVRSVIYPRTPEEIEFNV